jgi:outer membrane protein assembly factor BamB/ABC-type phosphate/phosphonate transport system substrate-binding protein
MLLLFGVVVGVSASAAAETPRSDEPLSMVVMDPLAAPLSCPCVAGYAQRKYDVLGEYLSERLRRPVVVTFAETIAGALEKEGVDDVHLAIGKDSVIRAAGKSLKLGVKPLARLTGKDGKTTQTGLVVVRAADPAKEAKDLVGYRILFGPADCDEKFAAARTLLSEAGVELPPAEASEISAACSDGACQIIDWGDKIRGAAVISSYAAPLLEGCGTIKKGDLRVVAETKSVPFIAAFATNRLSDEEQGEVRKALLESSRAPGMLIALETMLGFVPLNFVPVELPKLPASTEGAAGEAKTQAEAAPAEEGRTTTEYWPGWMGPQRNGRVAWLPRELGESVKIVWRRPLERSGLGGLAATDRYVFVGDRDAANRADVFRCLDAATGDELWTVAYPAPGQLDYDNSPRATPLIHDGRIYFFGAFGDLTCADIETGRVAWRMNIRLKFLALDQLPWGTCSSPLAVDDMIIVNPGARNAAVVALDAASGDVRWKAPGEPQGHGSFILATLGGVRQIVGHMQTHLAGWDPATGRQLWTLPPPNEGDFNVPTPLVVGERLLVCTENNGARLFKFDDDGRIVPEPAATCEQFAPQMSSPVAIGSRVVCVDRRLQCLDASHELRPGAELQDNAFTEFGAILASDDRLLIQGRGGELLLIDPAGEAPRIVSRLTLASNNADRQAELFTYPALVGSRLYVRCEREIVCVELAG